jgi:uncharacterized protein (TIGR00251 family)
MRSPPEKAWSTVPGGLMLDVRVTPRGGRDAIEGIDALADGRAVLRARLRVAPAQGEANSALVRLIADALAVAARQVTLVAGAKARIKRLKIEGDGTSLAARLERLTRGV